MIGIVGSGNVGANTAFFLAEKGVDDVMLYDVQKGLARGKALDMMEAAPIRGYRTRIQGTHDPEAVLGCDLLIITAGTVRKPGMNRDQLLGANREVILSYARQISNPRAKVILVPEPVDLLTTLFARHSVLPPTQIMGLGGFLDATRLRFFIANTLGVSMDNVSAQVVGRHTDDMILVPGYCAVSGISLDHFLTQDQITELFDQTRKAGSLIVGLAERASAYYGPSAVIAELAEAICMDTGRLASVSHLLSGQLGIHDVAMSLPCVVGKNGIARTIEPQLSAADRRLMVQSAQLIQQTLKEDA